MILAFISCFVCIKKRRGWDENIHKRMRGKNERKTRLILPENVDYLISMFILSCIFEAVCTVCTLGIRSCSSWWAGSKWWVSIKLMIMIVLVLLLLPCMNVFNADGTQKILNLFLIQNKYLWWSSGGREEEKRTVRGSLHQIWWWSCHTLFLTSSSPPPPLISFFIPMLMLDVVRLEFWA